ncbi:hypothetical protein [Methylocystis echinoides]|jgi:hypothetical protein|uniref:Uncharacterized protein n=1 Tax=Methylocystis echinoides TaxID=29468 RepID=A0A9W6GR63_9HYPH|nr:hypothetical protein [Methylocystis echinoides]GLI91414.1 hypothetical protein LMG27198_04060 [Methylocystis echinoides]
MVDTRKSDAFSTPARARKGGLKSGRNDPETQAFVVSAYGLERQAGWTLPRAGARPINLERRARFARFDIA